MDLRNLSEKEISVFMAEMGEKPFRTKQILKWLYRLGAGDIAEMTNISKNLRLRLSERAYIGRLNPIDMKTSIDGAQKILWELIDGERIESVIIPEIGRITLCISSQVGCAMGCRFCRTAQMGLIRNLTVSEIIGQVLGVREILGEDSHSSINLVFMGMGEPLANRENVVNSLKMLTDSELTEISRRRVSISTVGPAPQLSQLAESITVGLTVSLNASNDKVRDHLMPINRKYPMGVLKEAMSHFPLPNRRRITIAYVLLAGINDSEQDAHELAGYLHGLKVKINLIPFNSYPGAEFTRSEDQAVERFQEILIDKKYTVMIRASKGGDVNAACGQLAAEHRKNRVDCA